METFWKKYFILPSTYVLKIPEGTYTGCGSIFVTFKHDILHILTFLLHYFRLYKMLIKN